MPACYQPLLSAAPKRLINALGQPEFGLFTDAVPELALAEFDYRSVLDKPLGQLRRYFAQKQFQFVTVSGKHWVEGQAKDWLLAVAIADVRYVNSGFVYLFQQDQQVFAQGILRPLQLGCRMSLSSQQGAASLKAGRRRWQLEPQPTQWLVEIDCGPLQASLVLHLADPALSSDNSATTKQQPPLALCAPTGYQGFTYTEKNNALAVSGQLSFAGQALDLRLARAGYDFSAGYMRRQTNWRWSSINTLLQQRPFGLNLAAGVNETGLTENALWLDGHIQHLSPAHFQFDRYQPDSCWQISTLCGELSLQFQPLFCRQEKIQTGLLASNFRQYVGYYQGYIRLADGQQLALAQCLGLAEDHYAKW